MPIYRRRDLKPAKPPDDERFLRAAKAAATRALNRQERERRIEAADAESRRNQPGQGGRRNAASERPANDP